MRRTKLRDKLEKRERGREKRERGREKRESLKVRRTKLRDKLEKREKRYIKYEILSLQPIYICKFK